jgi:hypothetical protein
VRFRAPSSTKLQKVSKKGRKVYKSVAVHHGIDEDELEDALCLLTNEYSHCEGVLNLKL